MRFHVVGRGVIFSDRGGFGGSEYHGGEEGEAESFTYIPRTHWNKSSAESTPRVAEAPSQSVWPCHSTRAVACMLAVRVEAFCMIQLVQIDLYTCLC